MLDTLGRIIDPAPQRQQTIESVNLLAEILLTPHQLEHDADENDRQSLSAIENLVLCILCKIRSGQSDEAAQLVNRWLKKSSVNSFNTAASTLCDADCFKRGGPQVFTPASTRKIIVDKQAVHRSVSYIKDLSLGELLLLNATRLRVRTLPFADYSNQVVPLLRENLALPRIESLIDALLLESLQYGTEAPDIRCLCSQVLSICESRFLGAISAFATGDNELIALKLRLWLPKTSVERLQTRTTEFQSIINNLGAAVPRRDWEENTLSHKLDRQHRCEHSNEAPMFH